MKKVKDLTQIVNEWKVHSEFECVKRTGVLKSEVTKKDNDREKKITNIVSMSALHQKLMNETKKELEN